MFNTVMRQLIRVLLLVFLTQIFQPIDSSYSDEAKPSAKAVDDFLLLDQNGIAHQLSYYSDHKAIVLIAHGIGCPIMRQSIPELNKLQEQFQAKGAVFFMVNAVGQDDHDAIFEDAREYNIQIPILEDRSQLVSKAIGFSRSAQVIVVDPHDWKIVYNGPVDDRFNYETQKKTAQVHYLKDVLTRMTAGKKVKPANIPAKGCLIHFAKDEKNISYSNDIAPILIKSCIPCHSPGGVAPWSMDNYQKVKGWSSMMREVLLTRRMPPWQADPHYGAFKNDISLTDDELTKLISWINQDAPRGEGPDPLTNVQRPVFADWTMGPPDLLFAFDKQRVIPPTGTISYQVVPADKPVEKDIWIRALDLRPGNRKAVHHCDVAVQFPEELFKGDQAKAQKAWSKQSGMSVDGVGQIVAGYAPGYDNILVLPEGTGLFIPKGAQLNFWMHYITTGKEERDTTQLGLYLYQGRPLRIYSVVHISNKSIQIPPGKKEYRISAEHVFDKDVELVSLTPHMHYRGRRMKLRAVYPDGKEEILLSVPYFKFNWQRRYLLKSPKAVPAGTKIIAEGVYDNSAQNPDNPDPAKLVKFGSRSEDEMFSAFIAYTSANDQ